MTETKAIKFLSPVLIPVHVILGKRFSVIDVFFKIACDVNKRHNSSPLSFSVDEA